MGFSARQSLCDFNDWKAPFELPFFLLDEIGQISDRICCPRNTFAKYFREQIVSYDICEDG